MFTRQWFKDMAERALATFVQAFLAIIIASETLNVSTLKAAMVAGIAAVLSAVKSALATKVGNPSSASLAPSVGAEEPTPGEAP